MNIVYMYKKLHLLYSPIYLIIVHLNFMVFPMRKLLIIIVSIEKGNSSSILSMYILVYIKITRCQTKLLQCRQSIISFPYEHFISHKLILNL